MLKKVLSVGRYVQTAISFGLKAEKGIKTFSAFMKHLQAFETERKRIWGEKETLNVEQKIE